ncbi:MAG: ABC transporter substrate-binding protein, partial [Nitrososphaerales archaeon]
VVLLLLVIFSLASAYSIAKPAPIFSAAASCPASKTITFVAEPIPQGFNYLTAAGTSSFYIAGLQYLSLTPFPLEPNGSLDWSESLSNWITSNSNYTQWTFHIRPGATWSNGTAVAASDIVTWASPSYALNSQYDFVGLHTEVTGVRAINSDTVTFNLNVSSAQFPNLISAYYYSPVVSPTDVSKGPADTLFGTGVADGPWYVSNYTSGSTTALMLPNPYWPGPKPAACAIDVIFVENAAQMIPFLISGQADFAGPLEYGNIAALQGHSNIHIHSKGGEFGTDLQFNITEYPYNMTQFRQALAYSINSSAIVQQALFGYGMTANNAQGGVPSTYASYNPNQQQYPYNLSKAVSLLHQIGFTGGGSSSIPLKFPNGTAMTTTIYTDSNKAFDPDVAVQVAGFLQKLGINSQTESLTTQNLGADYASNAFNIRNNLVIYTSGGPVYVSPWLDAQQGCNVIGIPGCYGWQATPSADGQTHWLYPESADVQYQSNLSAINNTPPTNITGQIHYLNNIQSLNAEYLPMIMLSFPDKTFGYNDARWIDWPSYYFVFTYLNASMFGALKPASSSTTSTVVTSTTSSTSITSSTMSTSTSSPSVTSAHSNTTTSTTATSTSNIGTIELIAGIVIVIVIIAGIAAFMLRRRPTT